MGFNFIPQTIAEDKKREIELPMIYELARDLDTLNLLVENGEFYYVSKNDAIKIWVLKALHKDSQRYENLAYSSDYGNEIRGLFGGYLKEPLLKSELKRVIKEALLVNPYITKLSNFTFKKSGLSAIDVTFVVSTIYGDFTQEMSIEKE